MLTIHEETYPIVSIQFDQVATLADTKTYLARFAHWLAQKHQFGVIVHQSYAPESSQPDPDQIAAVHRLTMQWAKQHKAAISQFCVGLALVIDLPEIPPDRQRSSAKTITAIFGCPGQAFITCAAARQWIQQQL
ncbi:hypothetical protein [Pantanalinema sp. GBBB05]|uniref:hypothetical protein n=1 Tax=Pantanalinema sp. GBBB05 TaxID=2604139 RepID=UPI001DF37262|nr:hypothetical protein [Pantanalinema sp. GBBB05]